MYYGSEFQNGGSVAIDMAVGVAVGASAAATYDVLEATEAAQANLRKDAGNQITSIYQSLASHQVARIDQPGHEPLQSPITAEAVAIGLAATVSLIGIIKSIRMLQHKWMNNYAEKASKIVPDPYIPAFPSSQTYIQEQI